MVTRPSPVPRALAGAVYALVTLTSWHAHADPVDACIATAEEAQRLRLDGKLTHSRENLLSCAQSTCPAVVRSDCARWLAEVDALTPSLVLRAVDSAGADRIHVRVAIDEQLVTERLDGSEIHVDPGQHVFRLTCAGAPAVEQTVLVRAGEQHRTLSLVCPEPVSATPPQRATDGAELSRADAGVQPVQGTSSGSRVPLVWPIAAMGAGGIALAAASSFWISGLNEHAMLVSGCGTTHSCSPSEVDSAHQKLVVGDVTAVGGVALIALGVGILILGRTPAVRVAAAVHPVPGGALIGVRGDL
jgi:hypothetical protein